MSVAPKKLVWNEDYKITSYMVNLRGQAGLYALLNFVQDVGWQHALHLQVQLPKNLAWVFTRQKLIMNEWPAWNQTLTLRTWLRPPDAGPFLFRDYEVFLDDRKIGECTSTFTVMDMSTRKLAPQDWSGYTPIWREDHRLPYIPGKNPVRSQEEVQTLASFQVRNSDIDLNHHVNNTKYAQWILDALPIDILRAGVELREYEVNFMAETKLGDLVQVQKTPTDLATGSESFIHFQGLREADQKPVFTASMRVLFLESSTHS